MSYTFGEIYFGITHPWLIFNRGLELASLEKDPTLQFQKWYGAIKRCFWVHFPNAMCLSTIDENQRPDSRMVLLKHANENGFVFYTNYNSAKGLALAHAPHASLTFYWETIQRQVRVKGRVERVTDAESDAYFATRPPESQLGAWASNQSEVLASRKTLVERVAEFREKFRGAPIPRPAHWGGYRVIPERVEFMVLRTNRLHDRVAYTKQPDGSWQIQRLYP